MAKQFDLIVFDWDGTLMDSTSTIECIQAAARPGLPVPRRAASHVIGLGLQEAMQLVMPDVEPKSAAHGRTLPLPLSVARPRTGLFPACYEMLQGCRSRRISWRWPPARAASA
jgi:phosphoglycolate phosphatase